MRALHGQLAEPQYDGEQTENAHGGANRSERIEEGVVMQGTIVAADKAYGSVRSEVYPPVAKPKAYVSS